MKTSVLAAPRWLGPGCTSPSASSPQQPAAAAYSRSSCCRPPRRPLHVRAVAAPLHGGSSTNTQRIAAFTATASSTARAPARDIWAPALQLTPPQQQQQQQQQAAREASAVGTAHGSAGQRAVAATSPAPAPVLPEFTLVSPSWQPLVGRSRQHLKMEHEVKKAAATVLPVCISGEAGLHKLMLAAAIHTLGLEQQDASHPMVVVDCSTPGGQLQATQLLLADADGASSSSGTASDAVLLAALQQGTLVLNNAHKAPHELLALADAAVAALLPAKKAADNDAAPPAADQAVVGRLLRTCCTRLVLISQQPLAQLQQLLAEAAVPSSSASSSTAAGLGRVPSIAMPPLRTRASDIAPLALQAAEGAARLRGYGGVALSEGAAKRLTAYAFPGNVAELRGLVSRAVMLHPPAAVSASASASASSISSMAGSPAASLASLASYDAATAAGMAAGPAGGPVLLLEDADFWPATERADRGRLDVLQLLPWLKTLLFDTHLWPEGLNRITRMVYPLVIAALFLGPQDREHSAALTVFWAGWWPLVFISFPFVGRAWCAICPFMLTGREVQSIVDKDAHDSKPNRTAATAAADAAVPSSAAGAPAGGAAAAQAVPGTSAGAAAAAVAAVQHRLRSLLGKHGWGWQLKKWPVEQVSAWGGWFLVTAFASILVWEEVWDLPNSAVLSGWLLLLITGGAVACSLVYEKRLWCRYLCPVGGMNGLFAKLSMTEIRSRPGICAAAACSRPCHKGRLVPAPSGGSAAGGGEQQQRQQQPESQLTYVPGCPMNSYPAKHTDNHDCVMCGNCLRSCPQGSAQWRLRPPGADLWSGHHASWEELSLMYVLLGAVVLHRLPELCGQLGITPELLTADKGPHMAASAALLAAPGLLAWAWDAAGRAGLRQLKARAASRHQEVAGAGAAAGAGPGPGAAGAPGDSPAAAASPAPSVPFLQLSYSLLPLVWAGTLAHYEDLLLGELGLTLPRLAASLGAPADAAWLAALPALSLPVGAISAVQGCGLLLGGTLSWVLAGKIASEVVGPAAAGEAAAPQRLLILAVAAELWRLIV